VLKSLNKGGWKSIRGLLGAWVYPDPKLENGKKWDDRIKIALREVAGRMLNDIAAAVVERPGIHQKLVEYSREIGLDLPARLDPDYQVLFPGKSGLRGDWKQEETRQSAAAARLAEVWATIEPSQIARRITTLTREAFSVQNTWPDYSSIVCRLIAEKTDQPIRWIRAMKEADSFGAHIEPFLRRAMTLEDPEWSSIALELLGHPTWADVTIHLTLTSPSPPPDLLVEVLEGLSEQQSGFIHTLALRRQVPEETLRYLLRHGNPGIAFSVAAGEWFADPKGVIRDSLREEWRAAILGDRSRDREEYWLTEILQSDAELAYRWLEAQIPTEASMFLRSDNAVSVAAAALDTSQRRALLLRLPEDYTDSWLISLLVGDDLAVYRDFLADARWRQRHLDPLGWPSTGARYENQADITPVWIAKARLALEAGHSPAELAAFTLNSPKVWSGTASAMWQSWVEGFGALERHAIPPVSCLGREGVALAVKYRDEARSLEWNEAVLGC
jgi:hypothetical protein